MLKYRITMYRVGLSRGWSTGERLCWESGKDFNTEGTESTEVEEECRHASTHLQDNALHLKFEIGNLKRFGGVSGAGGIECGKISNRENAAFL
jgi:hypothetical protein